MLASQSQGEWEDPKRMLKHPKVKSSPLYAVLFHLFEFTSNPQMHAGDVAVVFVFLCQIKLQVKAMMAVDIPMAYRALLTLCNYDDTDQSYDQS